MKLFAHSFYFAFVVTLALAALPQNAAVAKSVKAKPVLGWLEHGNILPDGIKMDAKLDSGAKTTSLDAKILTDISEIDPDNVEPQTILFRIRNEDNEEQIIESELVGVTRVKRREGGVEVRPTVMLKLCVAGVPMEGKVNLTDRSLFNYPMLIGRDMMAAAKILINPHAIYTKNPKCAQQSAL